MKARLLLILLFFGLITINAGQILSNSGFDDYQLFAEIMPEPVGGMKSVFSKLEYPAAAREKGIEGKVYLLVFVNESGSVDEVKIVKSLNKECDFAAINAVRKSRFTPGKSEGKPVKVKLSLKIEFKLNIG